MSGETPRFPLFDSITAPSKEPYPINDTYTSHEDTEATKAKRRHRFTLIAGTSAVALSTLIAAPRSWIVDPLLQNAGAIGREDEAMSTFTSDLAGTSLRVECSNETLAQIDDANPLAEQERNFTRVGSTRTITLPGTDYTYALPVILLRDEVCDTIKGYNEQPVTLIDTVFNQSLDDTVWEYTDSLSTVLHEIEHANQAIDESEATCLSLQKLPDALIEKGFEPMLAHNLSSAMALYKQTQYPSEYFSDECRPGGAYDLGISDVYFGQDK